MLACRITALDATAIKSWNLRSPWNVRPELAKSSPKRWEGAKQIIFRRFGHLYGVYLDLVAVSDLGLASEYSQCALIYTQQRDTGNSSDPSEASNSHLASSDVLEILIDTPGCRGYFGVLAY